MGENTSKTPVSPLFLYVMNNHLFIHIYSRNGNYIFFNTPLQT